MNRRNCVAAYVKAAQQIDLEVIQRVDVAFAARVIFAGLALGNRRFFPDGTGFLQLWHSLILVFLDEEADDLHEGSERLGFVVADLVYEFDRA